VLLEEKKKQVEAANPVPTLGKPTCVVRPIPSITALPCLWRRESSLIYNEKVKALGIPSKGYFFEPEIPIFYSGFHIGISTSQDAILNPRINLSVYSHLS
jgi:hypothetical protein